jgi:hypothetical protein
MEKANE